MSFNGKNKAVTFSFDDGLTQDIRLLEILNKYDLKCTFNLNSERLGRTNPFSVLKFLIKRLYLCSHLFD